MNRKERAVLEGVRDTVLFLKEGLQHPERGDVKILTMDDIRNLQHPQPLVFMDSRIYSILIGEASKFITTIDLTEPKPREAHQSLGFDVVYNLEFAPNRYPSKFDTRMQQYGTTDENLAFYLKGVELGLQHGLDNDRLLRLPSVRAEKSFDNLCLPDLSVKGDYWMSNQTRYGLNQAAFGDLERRVLKPLMKRMEKPPLLYLLTGLGKSR